MYIPVWVLVLVALALWWYVGTRASESSLGKLREEVEKLKKECEKRGDETEALQLTTEDLRHDMENADLDVYSGKLVFDRVVAKQLVLVDGQNKVRATLGMEAGDSPSLSFTDADGAVPTYLRHSPEGWAVLRLGNRGGEEVIATVDTRVNSRSDVGEGPFAFISVTDRDGFNTTIGRAHVIEKAGATSWDKLAAASVVMTKDRDVIWSAP